MYKKKAKAAKKMVTGGIALGAGMQSMPSGAAKTGVGKLSSGMGHAGTLISGGMVMDAVGGLKDSAKLKKKKKY